MGRCMVRIELLSCSLWPFAAGFESQRLLMCCDGDHKVCGMNTM
jgi:hypothetical protein